MPNIHMAAAALHAPQLVTEDAANEQYLAEQGITDGTMIFSALNRVAESLLAQAYEQRTANNIEALKLAKEEGWAESADGQALRTMIMEALDLEDIAKLIAGQRRG